MSAPDDLQPYFQEATSWDTDRAAQARRSARIAWRVAAASCLCATAAALALLALMPLKRVEPFVIRVDRSTGIVDVVPVYAGHAPMSRTVTRYFLTHYVTVCQRFDFATAASDYRQCGAFHTAQLNQRWAARWNRNNPRSPLNLHRDGSTVRVRVESVSFLQATGGTGSLAQVRYVKAERPADGGSVRFTHWIATVQYTYTRPSADPRQRRWNPLGFRIEAFSAEPEVLGETQPAAESAHD